MVQKNSQQTIEAFVLGVREADEEIKEPVGNTGETGSEVING